MADVTAIDSLAELARVRAFVKSGAARRLRLRSKVSLGELAEAAGVSKSTVHRWEHGQRVPRGAPALRYGALLDALQATARRRLAG